MHRTLNLCAQYVELSAQLRRLGVEVRALLLGMSAIAALAIGRAEARDTELLLSISEAVDYGELTNKVGHEVAFFFGSQRSATPIRSFGEFVTNKKTNSVGRPDKAACRWAMLSALIQFRDRAKSLGGNAVIGIVSYYKKQTTMSDTDYICHAGNIVAGVALKGTVVLLPPGAVTSLPKGAAR
jgi:uncharacterized protein YbjQ (UPF0145 family)